MFYESADPIWPTTNQFKTMSRGSMESKVRTIDDTAAKTSCNKLMRNELMRKTFGGNNTNTN